MTPKDPTPFRGPASSPALANRRRAGPLSLLLLCVALLPAIHACGGDPADELADELRDTEEPVELPPDPLEGLQLTLAMERLDYATGETIPVSLQLSNRSNEPRTLSFRTTQRYDLILWSEAGEELARWSDEQTFGQTLGEEVLDAGSDGPVWDVEWRAPEVPGTYRLEAVILPGEGELRMGVPLEVTEGR